MVVLKTNPNFVKYIFIFLNWKRTVCLSRALKIGNGETGFDLIYQKKKKKKKSRTWLWVFPPYT